MNNKYPEPRNLDGAYFRVLRDGQWNNVCFTDMLYSEQETIMLNQPAEWYKNLALHLATQLRYIGDKLDLVRD